MSSLLFLVTNLFWRGLCFSVKSILAVCYWGKKQVVPPIRNPLLLKSAKSLAAEIRQGKLKSEEVVQAYIDRIREVNPLLNAVVQDRFEEALQEAKSVDKLIQSQTFTQKQLEDEKPLLGIPLTIKLLINVKDCASTAACVLYRGRTATEDAPSVKILKDAGGIILAITNTPEFGFSFECNNVLYGKTCNPYDSTRTPGGSSGGEGALVGAGASVIGLGNDMVGSIRVPAHFTGIFSHKASYGLIDSSGTFLIPAEGGCADMVYTGPMCRYQEDMVLVTKLLMGDKGKEIDFSKQANFENLKIYYSTRVKDPLTVPVDKEIVKAIHKAVSHFAKNYGVTSKEVQIPHAELSSYIALSKMLERIPNIVEYITSGRMKKINFVSETLRYIVGKSTFSIPVVLLTLISKIPFFVDRKKVPYYQKIESKINDELDALLDENSVILYPTFSVTAPYHYEMLPLMPNICYTETFNFTGHPATCCPAGFDRNGMPLGLQIVGKKKNDSLTLACALELSKVFGGWKPPSHQ